MSEPSPARRLLLEQLESRQLLAGGIFSHSGGHSDRDVGHQHGPRPSHSLRDVRPADVRLQQNPRREMESAANPIRMDRVDSHPPPSEMRRSIPAPQSILPSSPVSVLGDTSSNDAPPLRAVESQSSIRVPLSSGGSITFLMVGNAQPGQRSSVLSNSTALTATPRDSSSQGTQPVSADNATPIAPPARGVGENAASESNSGPDRISNGDSKGGAISPFRIAETQSAEMQITVSQPTVSQYADPKQTVSTATNSMSKGNVVFEASVSKSPMLSGSAVHVIPLTQTSPSIEDGFGDSGTGRLAPFESFEPDDDEIASWEIDRSTIDRLRDFPETTEEDRIRLNDLAINDQAMAGWFGGPGGMIEIQHAGDVLTVPDAGGSVVVIPLDAVFGTYRWFELAASDQPVRDDTAVRDAVLAAIGGVQADQVAPLHEPGATRLGSLVYSGAALVAGTLALARRRKAASLMATNTARKDLAR